MLQILYDTLLSQGFGVFREKGYLFSEIWGEGSFILRDWGESITFWSFREQGAEENIL